MSHWTEDKATWKYLFRFSLSNTKNNDRYAQQEKHKQTHACETVECRTNKWGMTEWKIHILNEHTYSHLIIKKRKEHSQVFAEIGKKAKDKEGDLHAWP